MISWPSLHLMQTRMRAGELCAWHAPSIECSSLIHGESWWRSQQSITPPLHHLLSRHGRNTCWFICAAQGLKIYNSEWQLRCSELTRLSALPILDLRTEEETGGLHRWRLDTSYRSWSWRTRLRSVHWRTLWDPSLISRNTAAHLGRAELSTGKTRVTLTLLCDPDSM